MNRKTGPHKTFWDYADMYPPILVRILAKATANTPRSSDHIATVAGMDSAKVDYISTMLNWCNMPVIDMHKFLRGCGIDFSDPVTMHRLSVYINHVPKWRYLKKSPDWKTKYEPLLKRYYNHLKNGH